MPDAEGKLSPPDELAFRKVCARGIFQSSDRIIDNIHACTGCIAELIPPINEMSTGDMHHMWKDIRHTHHRFWNEAMYLLTQPGLTDMDFTTHTGPLIGFELCLRHAEAQCPKAHSREDSVMLSAILLDALCYLVGRALRCPKRRVVVTSTFTAESDWPRSCTDLFPRGPTVSIAQVIRIWDYIENSYTPSELHGQLVNSAKDLVQPVLLGPSRVNFTQRLLKTIEYSSQRVLNPAIEPLPRQQCWKLLALMVGLLSYMSSDWYGEVAPMFQGVEDRFLSALRLLAPALDRMESENAEDGHFLVVRFIHALDREQNITFAEKHRPRTVQGRSQDP